MAQPHKEKNVGQAAGWLIGLRLMVRGLGIVRTLILAGILLPVDFGRATLALSIVLFVDAITELRVSYSLIRSQDNPDGLYNSAWTLKIIRGAVSGLVIAFCAPFIGSFYGDPLLVKPLYLLAVAVVIGGFVNVGMAQFQREMDFRKVFLADASSRIASLIAAVAFALITKSFWAILVGYLVQRIVDVLVSYLMQPRRPTLGLAYAGEIIKHSKWLVLQGILFQVLLRADVFLIGKFAGPMALGPYYLAKMIAELIGTEMSSGLRVALFTKFVKQDRDARSIDQQVTGFQRLTNAALLSLMIGAPLSILLGLCANDLISFALKSEWSPAAEFLQIFSANALFGVAAAAPAAAILAAGHTKMVALRQAIGLAFFIPTLWLAAQAYGLQGAAMAVALTTLVSTLFSFFIAMRDVDRDWRVVGSGLFRIAVALAVLTVVAVSVSMLLPAVSERWNPMHIIRIAMIGFTALPAYGLVIRWQWQLRGKPDTFERLAGDAISSAWHGLMNKRNGP